VDGRFALFWPVNAQVRGYHGPALEHRPTVRAAVVGTGFAASAHVEAVRRVPGVEVVAIAGRTTERARTAAQRLAIPVSLGDGRELLRDHAVDVVHVCTPNDLHADMTAAALDAGKHVLSEKPLAMDAGQTADLARRAAGADTVTGVCFNYRHYPLVAETRQILATGAEGEPHLIRGGYLQDWLLEQKDWNWRLESARGGSSRAMADIGSHWIDLIQHVTGRRVTRVYARTGRLHDVRRRPAGEAGTFVHGTGEDTVAVRVDTEDFATVLLDLEGGCPAVLNVSQVSPGLRNRLTFEIDTTRASLHWNQEYPNRLWIGRRDQPNDELVRDPALLSPPAARLAHYPAGHDEGWPDALKNLMIDFYGAVRTHAAGREPPASAVATFAEADQVMRVVEAVMESARNDRWVEIAA
jgi:predicted dehydrogenase